MLESFKLGFEKMANLATSAVSSFRGASNAAGNMARQAGGAIAKPMSQAMPSGRLSKASIATPYQAAQTAKRNHAVSAINPKDGQMKVVNAQEFQQRIARGRLMNQEVKREAKNVGNFAAQPQRTVKQNTTQRVANKDLAKPEPVKPTAVNPHNNEGQRRALQASGKFTPEPSVTQRWQ